MGSKSDAYELDVLRATTGQATTVLTTTPITPWVALFTVAPTDSTAGTEVTGGSYARVSSAGKWAAPSAGAVTTNAVITFPTATAGWGTPVAFGIMTAVTAGTLLMYDAVVAPFQAVITGQTPRFLAGSLTLTED